MFERMVNHDEEILFLLPYRAQYRDHCFPVYLLESIVYTGWKDHNEERTEENQPPLSAKQYLSSDHFISGTFETGRGSFYKWLSMCC